VRRTLARLRGIPMLWLLGLAAGFTNVGFNWAVTQGDVVRVVLLFYLMPLERAAGLAAAGRAAHRRRARGWRWRWPAWWWCSRRRARDWPCRSSLPDWLALAGGFSFAVTNILLRHLHARAGRIARAGDVLRLRRAGGVARRWSAPALGAFASPLPATPGWLGWAVLLGSAGFVVGNVCLQYGAARLAASAPR
jgi:hypothetical protein